MLTEIKDHFLIAETRLQRTLEKAHEFFAPKSSAIQMNTQPIRTGWQRYNTAFNCYLVFLCYLLIGSWIAPEIHADEVRSGDKVTVVTPGVEARLCPLPACGPNQHTTRIPEGTVLKVENTADFVIGTIKVIWFEVVYEEYRGWISIYDTDMAKK